MPSPEPISPEMLPLIVYEFVVQLIATLLMSALAIEPNPFVTVQVWLGVLGCDCTVTA